MARTILAALAALALVQAAGLARLAAAQTQPWNQEVVTTTAGELEDAVSGLRDVVRGSPNLDIPTKRRTMYQIIDNLRMIEGSAASLHASLKKGAGMEETLPTYKRLQQLRRETAVLAQRVDITAVTRPKLDKAQELLKKIEPYYPEEPKGPEVKAN
ncbi:MAG TPA: hypothetical protein VEI82_06305 [Myxococcota bacterium]|nr:hypothetical protein [Myxococcota bacterium]